MATIDEVLALLIPPDAVRITIPYLPPSANAHYQRTKRGGLCLSKAAQRFRWDVRLLAGDAIHRFEKSSAFGVYIGLYLGQAKRLDVDNPLKEVLDALQHSVIPSDDSQFKLAISRCIPRADISRTEIIVWALP